MFMFTSMFLLHIQVQVHCHIYVHIWIYINANIYQVLNLFLALLLSSFGASNLSGATSEDDGTNKLTEAFRFTLFHSHFTFIFTFTSPSSPSGSHIFTFTFTSSTRHSVSHHLLSLSQAHFVSTFTNSLLGLRFTLTGLNFTFKSLSKCTNIFQIFSTLSDIF